MGFKQFINRNLVVIVMVPSIVGLHYGWKVMQEMDSLVSPEERKELPIIILAKKMFTFNFNIPQANVTTAQAKEVDTK